MRACSGRVGTLVDSIYLDSLCTLIEYYDAAKMCLCVCERETVLQSSMTQRGREQNARFPGQSRSVPACVRVTVSGWRSCGYLCSPFLAVDATPPRG